MGTSMPTQLPIFNCVGYMPYNLFIIYALTLCIASLALDHI